VIKIPTLTQQQIDLILLERKEYRTPWKQLAREVNIPARALIKWLRAYQQEAQYK